MHNAPLQLSIGQLSAVEAAYASPPRAYHDFMHVREVLHHYADVAVGPGWTQPVEVYLAVLYHDAIYQPGRKDNEAFLIYMRNEYLCHVKNLSIPYV